MNLVLSRFILTFVLVLARIGFCSSQEVARPGPRAFSIPCHVTTRAGTRESFLGRRFFFFWSSRSGRGWVMPFSSGGSSWLLSVVKVSTVSKNVSFLVLSSVSFFSCC